MDSEKWRKEFGTDDLPKTFDYKEKPEVSGYYPQYYHKTDKVCHYFSLICHWYFRLVFHQPISRFTRPSMADD
jgi:hypothetical protein